MENRRQYFRHGFDAAQRMTAVFQSLDGAQSFTAEIVNLSIGGMCAVPQTETTDTAGRWQVTFSLDERPMQMMAERVYSVGEQPGHCGFHFLPVAAVKHKEAQEQAIWKFLLHKQREERRQVRKTG